MALLTLANLLDEIYAEIPSAVQANVVRAVNKVIRRLYTDFVEPDRSTFTTLPSVSTGTVDVTIDSTTVEFSDNVLATTDPLRLIQIEGEQAWFTLARTDANTGVISSKWPAATTTLNTYTINYPTITFPYAVGEILAIWREGFEPLKFSADSRLTTILPQVTSGIPTHWSPYVHDESAVSPNNELRRVFLTPTPLTRLVYSFSYKPRAPFMDPAGATTQTIPIRDLWYESIVAGTLFWLWKQEADKDRAFMQNAVFEAALARARTSDLPASIIRPRRTRSGILAYENRPIGDS